MKTYIITSLFLFIGLIGSSQNNRQKKLEQRPSFGVIMNEDGDLAYVTPDPVAAEKMLRANVDGYGRLGVNTYVFCLGSGSDVLYYQTQVASAVGWRKTKYEDNNDVWRYRTESARKCIAAGLDAVRIAGRQAKKNGMLFIPSQRMNDSHFMSDPYNYPLTGKFWLENTDLIIKDSPIEFNKDYGNLLNFQHEKVRDFRFAIFEEAIERYKDIIDGFELDFNRVQVFFPKGMADQGAPLMTGLVRRVRTRLNKLSAEQGRPMYLFVRIPPAEESCKWAGLEIDTWMQEHLVDLISPSQLMTLAHDMPIANMVKKARQHNVQVYPSIYPRTSFRVPLQPSVSDVGMNGKAGRDVSLAEALGAVSNYRWMGVDGFYLFNYYGFPHLHYKYEMTSQFKHYMADGNERVFAVTKTYYNDNREPSYAYVKQLPYNVDKRASFKLIVGDDLTDLPFPITTCVLRIGLKNFSDNNIVVKINGNTLKRREEIDHLTANNDGMRLPADAAEKSIIFPVNELSYINQGENIIEIAVSGSIVTDIEVGYSCFNNLGEIMLGKDIPKLNMN